MFEVERKRLVDRLVSAGYLNTRRVIDAMKSVERHLFVPAAIRDNAYEDSPQPIGFDQTISAPHMVAIMTELLDVGVADRILEIGTGSGYQAALLSKLAPNGIVYTLERIDDIAKRTRTLLKDLGYANVTVVTGDGTLGYPSQAPYDRIIVTAAAPKIPEPLMQQLAPEGRMLIPVGGRIYQDLIAVDKDSSGATSEKSHGGCIFVPLIGDKGWEPRRN